MDTNLFLNILNYIRNGQITIINYHNFKEFDNFDEELWNDVRLFPKYTNDGRYEKILFDALDNSAKFNLDYQDFLKNIEFELAKLSVPCIILIPLNFLDNDSISDNIVLSDNIKIFKTDTVVYEYKLFRTTKKKTALEEYYEKTIYAKLLREHILSVKDSNFFNYPILTIKIDNIDWKVRLESGRIASAVYAFIRMIDFNKRLDDGGWGYTMHAKFAPARLYGVYYNKEGTSSSPPYDNGYGYSLRFQCAPILDINTNKFLENLPLFTALLAKFIEYCFCDKRIISETNQTNLRKWQNAIQMFNNAYEFASVEKYDATIIFLLTILESLFISNSGNKKEKVILALENFFKQSNRFDKEKIRPLITKAYQLRNKFVHEGNGIDNEYVYIKSMQHYQGIFTGMKPFAHLGFGHSPIYRNELTELFQLVIAVLNDYPNEL